MSRRKKKNSPPARRPGPRATRSDQCSRAWLTESFRNASWGRIISAHSAGEEGGRDGCESVAWAGSGGERVQRRIKHTRRKRGCNCFFEVPEKSRRLRLCAPRKAA